MSEILRHKKTGGLYEVLFRGAWLRTDEPLGDYAEVAVCQHRDSDTVSVWPHRAPQEDDGRRRFTDSYAVLHPMAQIQADTPLIEGARVVVYRGKANGRVWVRSTSEMDDGRFEAVLAAQQTSMVSTLEERAKASIRYFGDGAAVRAGVPANEPAHIAVALLDLLSDPVPPGATGAPADAIAQARRLAADEAEERCS